MPNLTGLPILTFVPSLRNWPVMPTNTGITKVTANPCISTSTRLSILSTLTIVRVEYGRDGLADYIVNYEVSYNDCRGAS